MYEIEIKIPVPDMKKLKELLTENGFQAGKVICEKDIYFNRKEKDFRQTDEALRIRVSENQTEGTVCATWNYKGPKIDRISMSRMEYETEVADPQTAQKILEQLGFYPVLPVVKQRCYYHNGALTACADTVEGLGDFLELEILADHENDREPALERMSEVLELLGLSMKNTVRTSYLSMLEKQQKEVGMKMEEQS